MLLLPTKKQWLFSKWGLFLSRDAVNIALARYTQLTGRQCYVDRMEQGRLTVVCGQPRPSIPQPSSPLVAAPQPAPAVPCAHVVSGGNDLGAGDSGAAAAAAAAVPHGIPRSTKLNSDCKFVIRARLQKSGKWRITAHEEHTCPVSAQKVGITRSRIPPLVPLAATTTAQAIQDVLSAQGIAASATKCYRLLYDLQAAAGHGANEEQFRKLAAYLAREKQADQATTTDFCAPQSKFLRCFVAWGASKVIVDHVKPVMTLDGAHLSPEGTGCVRPSAFTFSLSPPSLQQHIAGALPCFNRCPEPNPSTCSCNR